jgi:DNA-binding MarR family transcriptional regulator
MCAQRPALDAALAAVDELVAARRRSSTGWLRDCDLSIGQVHVLATLQENGAMTVGALAEALAIAAPSATGIVDRLVERGLVERVRSEADRRVVQVSLSEGGRRAVEQMHGLGKAQVRRVFAELGDDDLAEVVRLAGLLRRASEKVAARQAAVSPR